MNCPALSVNDVRMTENMTTFYTITTKYLFPAAQFAFVLCKLIRATDNALNYSKRGKTQQVSSSKRENELLVNNDVRDDNLFSL
jgi:hypothetical protein